MSANVTNNNQNIVGETRYPVEVEETLHILGDYFFTISHCILLVFDVEKLQWKPEPLAVGPVCVYNLEPTKLTVQINRRDCIKNLRFYFIKDSAYNLNSDLLIFKTNKFGIVSLYSSLTGEVTRLHGFLLALRAGRLNEQIDGDERVQKLRQRPKSADIFLHPMANNTKKKMSEVKDKTSKTTGQTKNEKSLMSNVQPDVVPTEDTLADAEVSRISDAATQHQFSSLNRPSSTAATEQNVKYPITSCLINNLGLVNCGADIILTPPGKNNILCKISKDNPKLLMRPTLSYEEVLRMLLQATFTEYLHEKHPDLTLSSSMDALDTLVATAKLIKSKELTESMLISSSIKNANAADPSQFISLGDIPMPDMQLIAVEEQAKSMEEKPHAQIYKRLSNDVSIIVDGRKSAQTTRRGPKFLQRGL